MIPDYFCKTLSSQLCAILLLRLYNWTNLVCIPNCAPVVYQGRLRCAVTNCQSVSNPKYHGWSNYKEQRTRSRTVVFVGASI